MEALRQQWPLILAIVVALTGFGYYCYVLYSRHMLWSTFLELAKALFKITVEQMTDEQVKFLADMLYDTVVAPTFLKYVFNKEGVENFILFQFHQLKQTFVVARAAMPPLDNSQ